MEQLADFKNGARKTADTGKRNTITMSGNAAGLTDAENRAAAEYFASIKMPRWIKVVETDTVPKTRNANWFYVPLEGNETEPLAAEFWKCRWIPRELKPIATRIRAGLPTCPRAASRRAKIWFCGAARARQSLAPRAMARV